LVQWEDGGGGDGQGEDGSTAEAATAGVKTEAAKTEESLGVVQEKKAPPDIVSQAAQEPLPP
jgi:hypothetical protein